MNNNKQDLNNTSILKFLGLDQEIYEEHSELILECYVASKEEKPPFLNSDVLYDLCKKVLFDSNKERIIDFFLKELNSDFIIDNESRSIEVLDVYYFVQNNFFIQVNLCHELYPDLYSKYESQLSLDFDTEFIENILEAIADKLEIDIAYEWMLWASCVEDYSSVAIDLTKECWRIAKQKSNSSVIGFISHATGGSYRVNMDNDDSISTTGAYQIKNYLEELGKNPLKIPEQAAYKNNSGSATKTKENNNNTLWSKLKRLWA